MEEYNKQLKSIWGNWWEPLRKWFYPTWLIYEFSIRFYDYGQSVHDYFIEQQSFIGEFGAQILAIFFSIATFIICSFYLTIPTCFTLFRFFQTKNLTNYPIEERIKRFF